MTLQADGKEAERSGAPDAPGPDSARRGPPMADGAPSAMELSSMPLDPIYGWGIVLEPVEVMIEKTSDFVAELARETYQRGASLSDEQLEDRFLAFFDRLVEEGTLRRLPDAPPAMGRRILGPGRWLDAQRIRMQRLIDYWRERDRTAT